MFLLFDLEILLVYPYAVSTNTNDIYGLSIMLIFFVLLTLGFVFELGKGALTIESRQTSSYSTQDNTIPHAFIPKSNSIIQANNRVLKVSGIGPNGIFTLPIYTIVLYITYTDLSVYTFLQDGMDFLRGFAELNPQHPSIKYVYEQYISMKNTNFSVVNFVYNTYSIIPNIRLTGFPNPDHLLQLHCNIQKYTYISNFFYLLLSSLTYFIGVNIQNIVNFVLTILNQPFNFFSGMKKKSSGYEGANKYTSTQASSGGSNYTPIDPKSGVVTAEKKSNGGSDGGDGKDPGKNKVMDIPADNGFSLTVRELSRILRILRDRVLHLRSQPDYNMPGVFGAYNGREVVTFNQIFHYIAHNPHEILSLPNSNIQIGQLLTLNMINFINSKGDNYNDQSIHSLNHLA